jgi:hypothetical protein
MQQSKHWKTQQSTTLEIGNPKNATPTQQFANYKPHPIPTIYKLETPKMQQSGHWKPNPNPTIYKLETQP